MISGDKTRRIARYLPIDHCAEGCGYAEPKDGQQFVGIPYQWSAEQSAPYIEVRDADGNVIRTVNALDVSEIEFAD
jgi:hypothetical protein